MGNPVFCGNASFADMVQNEGQWLGWVYYDAYKQTYSQSILWIYAVLAIIGNSAVIIWRAVGFRHSRDKLLSVFFISLATADFLWGIHLLLFQIVIQQCEGTESIFNGNVCRVSGFIFTMGAPAARLNLIIIAFHLGLNFLCKGKRYWRQKVATYVTSVLLIVSWTITLCEATVWSLKYYTGYIHVPELQGDYADWSTCSPIAWGVENSNTSGASNILTAGFAFTCFFLVSTTALYMGIICHACCLRKIYGAGVKAHGLNRWAVVLLMAVAVNALGAVPYIFRSILVFTGQISNYKTDASRAFDLTVSGIFLQFQIIVNPILYSIAEIIRRITLYRKKRQLYFTRKRGEEDWETMSTHAWGDTPDQPSDKRETELCLSASDRHVHCNSIESPVI